MAGRNWYSLDEMEDTDSTLPQLSNDQHTDLCPQVLKLMHTSTAVPSGHRHPHCPASAASRSDHSHSQSYGTFVIDYSVTQETDPAH